MKKWIIGLFVIAAGVVGLIWALNHKTAVAALPPRTLTVDRGDLAEKISVLGRTVPDPTHIYYVGTDLLPAGKVVWINPKAELGGFVTAGDELARLDDEYLKAQLDQAKAKKEAAESNVKRAEAAQERAQAAKGRAENVRKTAQSAVDAAQKYFDAIKSKEKDTEAKDKAAPGKETEEKDKPASGLEKKATEELKIAKEALVSYDAAVKEAAAAIKEADAAKQAADALVKEADIGIRVAEKALKPLTIKAPGSGTIIKKEVTLGQVVTPSATPVLFVLADLNKMQVIAHVGESDIARVRDGMEVRFKIDAYADEVAEFTGKVTRRADIPLTTPLGSGGQKVDAAALLTAPVLYSVVIDVLPLKDKTAFKLKAGLTANVDFVLREVKGVLRVPSDALGYKPDPLTADEEKAMAGRIVSEWKPLWIQQDGKRQVVWVQTGINGDGKTEITKVDGKLETGTQVIIEGPPASASGGLKLPFKL